MKSPRTLKCGRAILAGMLALSLVACETLPPDALKLAPESLEKRTLQTRKYEGISEADLLAASAGVIQDLGFNIDESETKLGVIVGSKERDATEAGQIAGAVFLALLTGVVVPVDKNQKLRVSLVVRPTHDNDVKKHFVRVTFQRVVWNTGGQVSRTESLDKPEMYQEFFDRLSRAVFLEGHKI
jgi:hypothetical protein